MNKSNILLFRNRKALNEHFSTVSEEENQKYDALASKVLDFYQKVYDTERQHLSYAMFDYEFYGFGYNKNDGYYVVDYDSSNSFVLLSFGESLDDAFLFLANKILDKKRIEYEQEHKRELRKEYKERFKALKAFDRLSKAEYDLNMWNKYFDNNVPDNIINYYLSYVNNTYGLYESNGYFEYNKEFIYKEKTRSLVK